MQIKLSESLRCNDMVAASHFPRFFGTAIQYEIARFPRSVVKIGLNMKWKISVFWVEFTCELRQILSYHTSTHNMWAVQLLKRGIYKTPCKPLRNLAKIQMSSKHVLPHGYYQRVTKRKRVTFIWSLLWKITLRWRYPYKINYADDNVCSETTLQTW